MFWAGLVSKGRTKQFDFFRWFSYLKNVVLSKGFRNVQNVIQMAIKYLFFPKILKNRPSAKGFFPQTPISRDVFKGGPWCHAPPLGRQDSIISIEQYAKLRHGPPFVTWAESLSTRKGQNLGGDLWSSPNFEPKT